MYKLFACFIIYNKFEAQVIKIKRTKLVEQ